MSIAVIDARAWQNRFDLETGRPSAEDGPLVDMAAGVLARHPYPGDTAQQSNRWVSDTALDLIAHYDPQLVCLSYAQLYFADRFTALGGSERQVLVGQLWAEIDRFVKASGFTPVVIGSGEMTAQIGEVDLSKLDGLAECSAWSARYAGLHHPSQRDLAFVASLPQIERIVPLQEWMDLFGQVPPDLTHMPHYLVVSKPGWGYRSGSASLRRAYRIPTFSPTLPVRAPWTVPDSLTQMRGMIEAKLATHKIALILLEGIGRDDFDAPHSQIRNGRDWFTYEPGEGQYLTLTSGRHQVFAYPAGYPLYERNVEGKRFPFSGYFDTIPENTLGQTFDGRSIAVGNRSMFTHMVFGADICIECFARNLFNQGCMAVVHRQDKDLPGRGPTAIDRSSLILS